MTDFIMYTKAAFVSSAALFGMIWCVCGLNEALFDVAWTLAFLLVLASVIAISTTLLFVFCDWRNKRNEKSDPA